MKRILILAYDFPPYVSVGAQRPYSWFRHLKKHEIAPVVITRQWENKYGNHLDYIAKGYSDSPVTENTENGIIIRSPYKPNLSNRLLLKYGKNRFKIIRKSVTAFYEIMQWFFICGPKKEIYRQAKNYLLTNNIDLIIATGEPFILFRYATLLSKRFDIPWIADYRDPWSQSKSRSRNSIIQRLNIFLEKKYLKSTKQIITVSDLLKNMLSNLHANHEISIVKNGYDIVPKKQEPDVLANKNIPTISFAGTIYKWHPLKSFISQIELLQLEYLKKYKLRFIGTNLSNQEKAELISEFSNLSNYIEFTPKISHEKLIPELQKSDVLLLFNDYSILGTKIYDYIAVKKRILLCYQNDSKANSLKSKHFVLDNNSDLSNKLQEELILHTNSGIIAKDEAGLLNILVDLHDEFTSRGFIDCNTIVPDFLSRKHQAGLLAGIITKHLKNQ